MMQLDKTQLSTQEREIARTALEVAYRRETDSLVKLVCEKASKVGHIDDIWRLNDFLSARRFDLDGKYDDREEEILFALARLVKEGWLTNDDLIGFEPAKLSKINALTRIL